MIQKMEKSKKTKILIYNIKAKIRTIKRYLDKIDKIDTI